MKSSDYLPHADKKFDVWRKNFIKLLLMNSVAWGVTPASVTALQVFDTDWDTKWAVALNKTTRTPQDTLAKNTSKKSYITALRLFVKRWITANPVITNPVRLAIGTNVPKTTHTKSPIPIEIPVLEVDETIHTIHAVKFHQPSEFETNAKPDGVVSCEVRAQVDGLMPLVPENCPIVYIRGRAFKIIYDVSLVGKVVYYFARWINTRGIPGPWTLVLVKIIR